LEGLQKAVPERDKRQIIDHMRNRKERQNKEVIEEQHPMQNFLKGNQTNLQSADRQAFIGKLREAGNLQRK